MINQRCDCVYGKHGDISMIADCSIKHLTSDSHLERKNNRFEENSKRINAVLKKEYTFY